MHFHALAVWWSRLLRDYQPWPWSDGNDLPVNNSVPAVISCRCRPHAYPCDLTRKQWSISFHWPTVRCMCVCVCVFICNRRAHMRSCQNKLKELVPVGPSGRHTTQGLLIAAVRHIKVQRSLSNTVHFHGLNFVWNKWRWKCVTSCQTSGLIKNLDVHASPGKGAFVAIQYFDALQFNDLTFVF